MKASTIVGIIAILFIIVAAIYLEVGVWTECRQTNSFFYCFRVLGNR
jgi:hypothetical protein